MAKSKQGEEASAATDRRPADRNELGSLHKGLQALRALNRRRALTTSQLAAELKLSRTSARRILDTLVAAEVVDKVDGEGYYRLAPAVADLSIGLSEDQVLSHVAAPLLFEATKQIGWTIALVTFAQGEQFLDVTTQNQSPYSIQRFPQGHRTSISGSYAGKVAMAYLPVQEQQSLLIEMSRTAGRDVKDHFFTPVEADQVRRQGFYNPLMQKERESHLYVPVFMGQRAPGCLIMRYLLSAVPYGKLERHYAPLLQTLSARITASAVETMRDRVPAWVIQRAGERP